MASLSLYSPCNVWKGTASASKLCAPYVVTCIDCVHYVFYRLMKDEQTLSKLLIMRGQALKRFNHSCVNYINSYEVQMLP